MRIFDFWNKDWVLDTPLHRICQSTVSSFDMLLYCYDYNISPKLELAFWIWFLDQKARTRIISKVKYEIEYGFSLISIDIAIIHRPCPKWHPRPLQSSSRSTLCDIMLHNNYQVEIYFEGHCKFTRPQVHMKCAIWVRVIVMLDYFGHDITVKICPNFNSNRYLISTYLFIYMYVCMCIYALSC